MVESFNLSIDYVPVKKYDDLKKRNITQYERIKELETALRKIAAIDSTNDFTDSIIDIAQEVFIKNT